MTTLAPPIPHSYWVEPHRLVAGEHPGSTNDRYARASIRALLQAGVSVFLDLTEESEWVAYDHLFQPEAGQSQHSLAYWRKAIPDKQTPTVDQMTETLDLIDAALAAGHTVYVHCLAGIGRTGTVVGCYLVRHGMSGATALQALAHLRRQTLHADVCSPETEEQRRFVRTWKPGT